MIALDVVESTETDVVPRESAARSSHLVRVTVHVVVWTLLLAPMVRALARGWRPLADDATIAIGAWRALTLHPPLLGQLTSAAGVGKLASDPGPLEYWVLGPFVHLDPGQGVLIGSAVLCALVLSVAIEVLWRTSGTWAAVLFTFVMVDMAIVSPTPFLDPVWNNSFAFFWFAAFLGVAFTVGRGYLRYFPLLIFIGSVAVDSNLMYLPAIGLLLVAALVVGWRTRPPPDYRWLWWAAAVVAVCWVGPLYQQFFDDRPNLSLLLRPSQKTEGLVFGLRALSRAVSPNPIWAAPRPINEWATYGADIAHRNVLLGPIVVIVLVGIAVAAWRRKDSALVGMCMVSLGGAAGIVLLFARTPSTDLQSFIWINLAVWQIGACIWLTLGLALVTAIRPQLPEIRAQVSEVRAQLGRQPIRFSRRVRRASLVAALAVGGLAGTLVTVFPYGNQFVQDWGAVARVDRMTADIEHHLPQGRISMGVLASGFYQPISDEHGVAYLLLADGWLPGMEVPVDQLLGMPIHPKSPFVVFTEQGSNVTAVHFYQHYQPLWWLKKQ
jgi:hypothetical protein